MTYNPPIPSYNVLFNLGAENAASSQRSGVIMFNQSPTKRFGMLGRSTNVATPKVMLKWAGGKTLSWKKA